MTVNAGLLYALQWGGGVGVVGGGGGGGGTTCLLLAATIHRSGFWDFAGLSWAAKKTGNRLYAVQLGHFHHFGGVGVLKPPIVVLFRREGNYRHNFSDRLTKKRGVANRPKPSGGRGTRAFREEQGRGPQNQDGMGVTAANPKTAFPPGSLAGILFGRQAPARLGWWGRSRWAGCFFPAEKGTLDLKRGPWQGKGEARGPKTQGFSTGGAGSGPKGVQASRGYETIGTGHLNVLSERGEKPQGEKRGPVPP